LTSIEERLRMVRGTIQIDSKPMGGTKVHARVPFGSVQASRRQAV
jgi:signal transduction histidine kinase